MRVLGVETSTLAGGVALLDDDRVVGEYLLDVGVTHSERLLAAIDRVLTDARWTLDDVDALAVAVGPGSFTGLRIGLGTVKGLAFARATPIAAVPTLDGMAAALPFAALPVCPVIEARKNEVYTSRFRWTGADMSRDWDYLALPPDELAARLSEPTIVIGPAVRGIHSPHVRPVPSARRIPSAACVAQLGLERARRGETIGAAELVPFYLQPWQAELRRHGVAVA